MYALSNCADLWNSFKISRQQKRCSPCLPKVKETLAQYLQLSHWPYDVLLQILLLAVILITLECSVFYRCCQSESCNKTYRVSLCFISVHHISTCFQCLPAPALAHPAALSTALFSLPFIEDSKLGCKVTESVASFIWSTNRIKKN